MELQLDKVKDKMIMCRFAPNMFAELGKLAKKNKTSRGKVIRAIIETSLKNYETRPSQGE